MRTRATGRTGAPKAPPAAGRGVALLVLATLAAGVSCAPRSASPRALAEATPASLAVDDYYPLTDRSQWTYRIRDFTKNWTYLSKVRVHGRQHVDALSRDGISVEERYSSDSGPFFVEEQEPMLYFRERGYLNRVFLTYQGGKLVASSGSGDSEFLPERLTDGATWESNTQAFRVGDLGFRIRHTHRVSMERDPVKVPAGTFENCVRVDTFSTQGPGSGKNGAELLFYYSDWYAPGVGLVRTEQWEDEKHERERTRIELLEYRIERPEPLAAAGSAPKP